MNITLHEISVKNLVKGYQNSDEEGVLAYDKKLNVRPKYQREFIYGEKERNAVIATLMQNFPLNTMYWVKNSQTYELMDGQQRTLSIAMFVNGDFSMDINGRRCKFDNLTQSEQEIILNYKLMVYVCEGDDKEKLDWFKIINIAGKPLTMQELRNAIYTGEWLSSAKAYFSKTGCAAFQQGGKYLNGTAIRQDYLETALLWISALKYGKGDIERYMSENQHGKNADELWAYFSAVINWVQMKFPKYRKEMKGLEWGFFYNTYKNKNLDSTELENEVAKLMSDDEVTSKKGIYAFVLSRNEKYLNLREFSDSQKRQAYEKQGGICANKKCSNAGRKFEIDEMEADHIKAWSKGGKTELSNCQMLCRECNRTKSAK